MANKASVVDDTNDTSKADGVANTANVIDNELVMADKAVDELVELMMANKAVVELVALLMANKAVDELVELVVTNKTNDTNEANVANEAEEAKDDLTNENATD